MTSDADSVTDRIVDAFLGRLATRPFGEIELAEVATDAGVGLGDLRGLFDDRLAILKAFVRRIDTAVLAGDDPAMGGEPGRERLFDVLMRRFDALAPYREAVRSLARSVRADPALGLALNGVLVRSMAFMLGSARISTAGLMGRVKAQGLAIVWARTVDVWLDDTDPGLARTMMALDKELSKGERGLDFAERLHGGLRALDDRLSAFRRGRRERDRQPAPDAGADTMAAGEGI